MKALTLTQPWASLVAIGAKRVETRSWRTGYRGPLAIHAAKKFTQSDQAAVWRYPFRRVLVTPDGSGLAVALPLGCVVATCTLTACISTSNPSIHWRSLPLSDQERAFGNYAPGRWAWLLEDIKALPEPVLAKGALGLWEWTP